MSGVMSSGHVWNAPLFVFVLGAAMCHHNGPSSVVVEATERRLWSMQGLLAPNHLPSDANEYVRESIDHELAEEQRDQTHWSPPPPRR